MKPKIISNTIKGNNNRYIVCFLAFLLICSLPSCTVRKRIAVKPDYTSHFVGQSKADIIRTLGLFDVETSLGEEGTVCLYNNWSKLQSNNPYFKQIPSNVRIAYVRDISFFFDKDNICNHVTTNATDIQRKFSPGRTIGLATGLLGGILFIMALSE